MSDEITTSDSPMPEQVAPVEEAKPSPSFTQEDIERARAQEKDKLYPKIDRLQKRLDEFTSEAEDQKRQLAEEQARVDAERKRREEEEMSARELIERKDQEWSQKFEAAQEESLQKINALEEEAARNAALLEKEQQYQELMTYKNRRLQEEQDSLMPELLEFVTGNNKEEIDAAISVVQQRTSAIMEQMKANLPVQPTPPRGVPATGASPDTMDNSMEQQTFSEADLANMDMQTYIENRDRLKAAVTNQFYGRS